MINHSLNIKDLSEKFFTAEPFERVVIDQFRFSFMPPVCVSPFFCGKVKLGRELV